MKIWLGLIFILTSAHVFAINPPPPQEFVDQYLAIAITYDVKTLQGKKSNWECDYPIIHNTAGYIGYGKSESEAIRRVQLVCMKGECQRLGERSREATEELNAMSEQEYRDFLEFTGDSLEEIEAQMKNRGKLKPSEGLTCENAGPTYRLATFDSCVLLPIRCQETK